MAQNIVFKVSADTTGIRTGMEQAGQATKKVSKEVSILDKQFNQLGGAIVGAFAIGSVVAFGKAVFAVTAEVQSLQVRLNSLYGSEQGGAKALNELNTLANKLGLNFLDLSNNFVQFTAAAKASGMEVRQAEKIFKSMSVAIAGSGASAEQGRRAMLALTQMIGKGKISAEELRGQLGEALPSAMGIMAKSMGVSVQRLGEMMEKGQLLSNDVLPKFAKEMEKAFGADAEKLSQNATANLARLTNAWDKYASHLGERFYGSAGVGQVLADMVKAWDEINMSQDQYVKSETARLLGMDMETSFVDKQVSKLEERKTSLKETKAILDKLYQQQLSIARESKQNENPTAYLNAVKLAQAYKLQSNEIREQIDQSNKTIPLTEAETKALQKKREEVERVAYEMAKARREAMKEIFTLGKDFDFMGGDPFFTQGQKIKREGRIKEAQDEAEATSKINDLRKAQGDYEIQEAKRVADEKADIAKQEKALRIQLAESTLSGITTLSNAFYQKDLSKQTEALDKRLKAGQIGEEEYASAVRRIKRKAFIADQIAALSQIAISTAINIASVQNATSLGLLTPLYLTNAAIQAGVVLAQPVPYNKGTKRVPMMRNAVRGKDSVHAILTPDERVVPADINSQTGYSALLDLAHDRKITNEEAGMIASIAMGSSRSGAGSNIDSDALGRSIAKYLPATSVNINDRGIAIITERSQSEIRRLKTRIG
jgi:tape measure domain-containing protein